MSPCASEPPRAAGGPGIDGPDSDRRGRPPDPVRTVLFDLDGTLIDSRELILSSYRHTMAAHLGAVPPDAAWLRTMGTPLEAQLREFARDEREATAMLVTYRTHNARVHDQLVRPFAGVAETLEWLRDRRVRMAVVTSKLRDSAERGLAACGLDPGWFGALVTASEPVPHKPDPAPVRLALERLGTGPEGSLFVGDSVWDVRAGRAAGVRTAAALWGPFGRETLAPEEPDHLLGRIEEVRDFVSEADPS